MEDAARPYPPDTGGNLERVGVAGLLAPVSPCYDGIASFYYVCVERLLPCAVLLFIGGYYARMDHLGIIVDINTFSFG